MQTPRSALIAAWAIVLLAGVGFVFVFSWVVRLIAAAVVKTNVIPGLGGSVGWMLTNSSGSSWAIFWATILLATVTLALFLATTALGRAANVQSRLAGPFLNVMLITEELAQRNAAVYEYFRQIPFDDYGFAEADDADGNLSPLIANRPPEYVSFVVSNKQTAPHGVAADIRVDLTLYFGASSGSAPGHPFAIKRQIHLPLIEANTYLAGRAFNVAGLTGYMVSADQVEYKDISGLRRGAASGVGKINKTPQQSLITFRIFKPRRKEYTGGIGHR